MLFSDSFFTIEKASQGLFKDRGSKFIAFVYPVIRESEVKEHLSLLKKEHHSAVHHCYAYRIGAGKDAFKHSDDGEPSGTAGKPIYGQILSNDLTNILIVVVRYFGGTLLGTSGLINAYREAAADALLNAAKIEKHIMFEYKMCFNYVKTNDALKMIRETRSNIITQQFDNDCEVSFAIRKGMVGKLEELLGHSSEIKLSFIKILE